MKKLCRCGNLAAGAMSMALLAGVSVPVYADLHTWNSASGTWETADNWLPAAVPATGDGFRILTGTATLASAATIGSTSITAVQGAIHMVGYTNGSARAALRLLDGAVLTGSGGVLKVGLGGIGTLPAWEANKGLLEINSGATLSIGANVFIGAEGGNGELVMTGGTITRTAGDLYVGGNSIASTGTAFGKMTMSGGTGTTGAGTFYIGRSSVDKAALSKGEVHFSGSSKFTTGVLQIGSASHATSLGEGLMTISDSAEIIYDGHVTIGGVGGTGELRMTGGKLTRGTAGDFMVGSQTSSNASASGTLTISGGVLDLNGGAFRIGRTTVTGSASTMGVVDLSGNGKITVGSGLTEIGLSQSASGTVEAWGILKVSGSAVFETQKAVQIAAQNNVYARGLIEQKGGLVHLSGADSTDTLVVGRFGTGTYDISGGNLVVSGSSSDMRLGRFTSATGIFNQSGGNAYIRRTVTLAVSASSSALLAISGGTMSILANQSIGNLLENLDAPPTYNLVDSSDGTLYLGEAGSGVVTLSGSGALHVYGGNNGVLLARYAGSSGILNLNGGLLSTAFVQAGLGESALNFNGGILQAKRAEAQLIRMTANVKEGGAKIDSNGFNITITNTLASDATNDGGLTKLGEGNLTLAWYNFYNGKTVVKKGGLILGETSSLGSSTWLDVAQGAEFDSSARVSYALNSGMTVSGAGKIVGNIAVGAGRTIAAGDSVASAGDQTGTLTFADDLDLKTGAKVQWNISNASATAGEGWDLVKVDGVLSFSTGATDSFTIQILEGAIENFDPDQNYTWDIIEAGSIAGFDANRFNIEVLNSLLLGEFSVNTRSNQFVTLEYLAAIPEPSQLFAVVLGGGALLAYRRRRKS